MHTCWFVWYQFPTCLSEIGNIILKFLSSHAKSYYCEINHFLITSGRRDVFMMILQVREQAGSRGVRWLCGRS